MGEIRNIDTVHQYNSFMGVETLHPLVRIMDCIVFFSRN